MTNMFPLAAKSLWNRKYTTMLTVISIAMSVTLLLGVERIRTESKVSFMNTVSDTDLVVGARSGPIQLLLYSVFRIGDATNNISWSTYKKISGMKSIKWTIPISLGDSHKGYRVMGTLGEYFSLYKYGNKTKLEFQQGQQFKGLYDAVLGAEVARSLGYRIGDSIVLSHGAGEISFIEHADKPFTVVGILQPTGTPVDRTVHVSLEGIEAIHIGWENGVPQQGKRLDPKFLKKFKLTPKTITAFLVKLDSPITIFKTQRQINTYVTEPMMAIIPGVALKQLWDLIGLVEKALFVISFFVVVVGLFGMLTTLLASLNERRKEMAILRSVGAGPLTIFSLIVGETFVLTLTGIGLGIVIFYLTMFVAQPLLTSHIGLHINLTFLTMNEIVLMGVVLVAGILISFFPAWRIYKYSLIDGMTIRL
ncbi:MAG: ABC transporter permease [Desulfotalea sp.]